MASRQPGVSIAETEDEDIARIRLTLWRLRRGLADLVGEGVFQELFDLFQQLNAARRESNQTIVLWIRLVQTLVDSAESEFGSKRGLGPIKAQEVKGGVQRIIGDVRSLIGNFFKRAG